MPKRRYVRQPNAASVRRKLVFDANSEDIVPEVNHQNNTQDYGHLQNQNHQTMNMNATEKTSIAANDKSVNGHFEDPLLEMEDSEIDEEDSYFKSAFLYLVYLCCVGFIFLSFIPWLSTFLHGFHIEKAEDDKYYVSHSDKKILCLIGLLGSLCVAAVLGLSCCCFSWVVVYFDSLKPGRIPPTPLSPSKYRQRSGHSFHLNYVISGLNGLGLFVYCLWYNSDNFIL